MFEAAIMDRAYSTISPTRSARRLVEVRAFNGRCGTPCGTESGTDGQRPLIARLDIKGPNLSRSASRGAALIVIRRNTPAALRAGRDELIYMDIVATFMHAAKLTEIGGAAPRMMFCAHDGWWRGAQRGRCADCYVPALIKVGLTPPPCGVRS